jgi:hypothetical protein
VETIATTDELVDLEACPLCGSSGLEELPVRNLNSRSPARIEQLRRVVGSDFFVGQRISICQDCGLVFQSTRPRPEPLERLYANFAASVSKITPTAESMFEYIFVENAQDYIHAPAKSLAFLDEHGLLEGVESALELRTYGALLGLLKERGVTHTEGLYVQEFDADLARRVFGVDELRPFSFARPIEDYRPARDEYDLIVAHEGITHSLDPVGFLRGIRDHLSERGKAVLFREPNTPEYRRYMPLEMVFNNFHMNLLTEPTARALVARAGGLSVDVFKERHPSFAKALYLDLVLRRREGDSEAAADGRYGASYYRSWITWDARPERKPIRAARRSLARLGGQMGEAVKAEFKPVVWAVQKRFRRAT